MKIPNPYTARSIEGAQRRVREINLPDGRYHYPGEIPYDLPPCITCKKRCHIENMKCGDGSPKDVHR